MVVIRSRDALEAFTRVRMTLGSEMSVVAGPLGVGGVVESEIRHNSRNILYTYLKSRGLYVGVQINGTIILERSDANARFYGVRINAKAILSGREVDLDCPPAARNLIDVLESAEGRPVLEQAMRSWMDERLGDVDYGWGSAGHYGRLNGSTDHPYQDQVRRSADEKEA